MHSSSSLPKKTVSLIELLADRQVMEQPPVISGVSEINGPAQNYLAPCPTPIAPSWGWSASCSTTKRDRMPNQRGQCSLRCSCYWVFGSYYVLLMCSLAMVFFESEISETSSKSDFEPSNSDWQKGTWVRESCREIHDGHRFSVKYPWLQNVACFFKETNLGHSQPELACQVTES